MDKEYSEYLKKRHTDKYKHFNHYHEMTNEHEMVDFGDGEFIANKKAIPLLKALNDLGLRTRTHHVGENSGFVGILLRDGIYFHQHEVNERDRTKYNGEQELLIQWNNINNDKDK